MPPAGGVVCGVQEYLRDWGHWLLILHIGRIRQSSAKSSKCSTMQMRWPITRRTNNGCENMRGKTRRRQSPMAERVGAESVRQPIPVVAARSRRLEMPLQRWVMMGRIGET